MPDSIRNFLDRLRETWSGFPRQAQIIIPSVAVVILGGLIMLSVWSQGEDLTVLYKNLTPMNMSKVQDYLDIRGIIPELRSEDNAILVPKEIAPNLRVQIAYEDVISGDDGGMFGVGENAMLPSFHELQLKEQRNAERQLQQSIESLQPVYRAKVNLTLQTQSDYFEEDSPAKAAVNLKLHPGEELLPAQVEAIHKLIASSVRGLAMENVTVLDSQGNLLLAGDAGQSGMDSTLSNWEYEQQQGKTLERKILDLLAPAVGSEDKIRVGVQVQSDFDQTELMTRTYVNDDKVMVQEETTDETAQGDPQQGLPPGTASNVVSGANLAAGTNANGVTIQRKLDKKEYQPSISETRVVNAAGKIKRVTAAVTIHDAMPNGGGKWTEDNISSFEDLVKSTIGYDQTRGDLVTVSTFAFATSATGAAPSLLDRLMIYLPDLAKYAVIGLLGVMLLVLLRSVMGTLRIGEPLEPATLGPGMEGIPIGMDSEGALPGQSQQQAAEGGSGEALPEGIEVPDIGFDKPMTAAQLEMQQLQDMVERMASEDPDVILRVVQNWLSEDHTELDVIDDEE